MHKKDGVPNASRCWAVIPAAGAGTRMASDRPKQYLPLAGKTVLEHSLERLLSHRQISGAVLALSPQDTYWEELHCTSDKPLWLAVGGGKRCDSVLNALILLSEKADDHDWVLVHDAARPCVRQTDIDELISRCQLQGIGGLLAVPVKDTIKREAVHHAQALPRIQETVNRDGLWQAQTPQMFRLGELRQALIDASTTGVVITDEASAMEWAGQAPLLVEGHADNIKITRQEDLQLAAFFLSTS